ncbi:MAG TPA: hypothetical protein VH040_12640 [Usitatibacter sp.]|nr:hypothetical protein [Usitatibacter sp.]
MATSNLTEGRITLDREEVAAIRGALIVGLASLAEIERVIDDADPGPVKHPTGVSGSAGDFATALAFLEVAP